MLRFKEFLEEGKRADKIIHVAASVGLATTGAYLANKAAEVVHPFAQHALFHGVVKATSRPPIDDATYAANQKYSFDHASKMMKQLSKNKPHKATEHPSSKGFTTGRMTDFEDRRKQKPPKALAMYAHDIKTIYKAYKKWKEPGDHTK